MRTVVRVSETVLLTYILTQILPEDHIRKMRALMKNLKITNAAEGVKMSENIGNHGDLICLDLPMSSAHVLTLLFGQRMVVLINGKIAENCSANVSELMEA